MKSRLPILNFINYKISPNKPYALRNMKSMQSSFSLDCPIPSKPLYSTVKYAGTKNNDTVSYTCPRGYDLDGPSSRRCLVTSQWEQVEPVCLRMCSIYTNLKK